MAEATRVSEAEFERRESYLKAGKRERHVLDPYTWSYPYKVQYFDHSILAIEVLFRVLQLQRVWE